MPDATNAHERLLPPLTWGDAFAGMPADAPPTDGWQRVAAGLDAGARPPSPTARATSQRHRRFTGWLALAATLALAVALPWQRLHAPGSDAATAIANTDGALPQAGASGGAGTPPSMTELRAESALLETLLAHARDGRVATGSAAAMSAELEARLAAIDGALAEPGLDPGRERALWTERVRALQALASFEGTRRWLAANGEHYDGTLVQVN